MAKHCFTNDETADVHNWMSETEEVYNAYRDMTVEAWDSLPFHLGDKWGNARLKLSENLRRKALQDAPAISGLHGEIMFRALARVDWDQIAAHLMMEAKEAGELSGIQADES